MAVQDHFPFKEYFADAPGVLFRGNVFKEDMEAARGCWRHLRTMFQELEECRAFELLKVLMCFRVQGFHIGLRGSMVHAPSQLWKPLFQ